MSTLFLLLLFSCSGEASNVRFLAYTQRLVLALG